ncbi:YDG domain-containing protein [Caulobacter mirabilis]|uniref:Filamentous haemagglutinin FhaB/tRNA nuclease CdiA-like TPS domain-containing protein n=1 Tax=Caulobacter mirabilis TaxID=69666 RepID=A0A2D2B0T4_9CAUL|nr:YDG domain-containing protein [Caulobacter mirabilis]ATQ43864.1 hypothetical protein CSW64_16400 [Caulobacter mirabilis]
MTRPAPALRNRRHHLLGRTALAGLGVAVVIGATPAAAQVTGVGTITGTNSNGGAVGVTSGGGVTDITTSASRSIVNWTSLNVTTSEQLNFYFNNRDDIVVNRTGSASIDGVLNGCLATCATNGGNIWILSSGGVLVGGNARINTGGFLASTGGLTDADILDGDMNFSFSGAPAGSGVIVATGAQITAKGGTLALIAPVVNVNSGATLNATDGGDAVFGSAENYNVTFARTATDDLDLITFEVPSRSDGAGGSPVLALNGTVNANQVHAAIVSKSAVAASIIVGGAITATTASGENGDIVLSAGSGFFEGAALNPGGGFDGSITQDPGSILTATNVTMRAADNIAVSEINATGQVWLDSAWAGISQTGAIKAGSLRAEAAAGIDLSNAGNDFDTISLLDNNGAGTVSLTDLDGFQITGAVNNWVTAGTVNLTALNGSITQSGMGVIWAGRLNASATGDIALGNLTNHLTTLGTLTAGGAISYRGGTNFNLDGAVTAASLTLRSDTGAITQTAGSLNVAQLSAQAETGINLNRVGNGIAEITGLSTTSGDIVLISNGNLSLAGNVSAAAGTVSLQTFTGGITQNSGIITAGLFSAVADAGLTFGGQNQVAQLGVLTAGGTGDILFRNAGALVLTANVTAAGDDVSLYSTTGGITQDAGTAITAGTLTAAAAGGITLDNSGNSVDTINGLSTTSGDISFRTTTSLSLSGAITAPSNVSLRADGGHLLQSAGSITADKLNLHAAGTISLGQNSVAKLGRISAGGDFVTNAAGMSSGVLELTDDITTVGKAVLYNPGGVNQTGGRIQASSLVFDTGSGNLTASGPNQVTGLVELIGNNVTYNATGGLGLWLNVTGSASITTGGSLAFTGGSASSVGGTLSLDAATGIYQLRALSAGSFGTIINRTIGGVVLNNVSSAINLAGNVTAAGQSVSLRSNTGQIEQTGGVITADVLNLQAAGRIWVNNANAVATLGRVIAGGHVLFRNDGNTVVGDDITASGFDVTLRSNSGSITQTAGSDITSSYLQAIAATGITLTNLGNNIGEIAWLDGGSGAIAFGQTNGFEIDGPVFGAGRVVTLSSASGDIMQNGGAINAGTLNLSAGGAIGLGGNNSATSLGTVSAGGAFVFHNQTNLALTGDITVVGQVQLSTANGGAINQTGGGIIADRLLVSAEGDITLNSITNDVSWIYGLASTGGNILYRDANSFELQGNITTAVDKGAVLRTVAAGATITQAAGIINVGYFGANTNGSITLDGANRIRRLVATSSSAGDVSINTTTDLAIGQPVTAGQTLSLTSGGRIYEDSAGYIVANTLNLSAVTGISLPHAGPIFVNSVQNLGTITNSTSGGIVIANYSGSNTRLTGNISAAGQSVSITDVAGGINQAGGIVTADTLSLSATGAINLGAQNAVINLGAVTSGGNFTFTNASWLELDGDISAAGQSVTLNVTNGGIIQNSGGTITANRLSATTTQGAILGELNNVAQLGVIDVGSHNFSFRTVGDLLIDGDITSTLNVLLTSANGSITQTAGSDITAGGLNVWAQTGINLTNAGNNATRILGLMNLGSGGIAYGQTNGFQIDGTVRALNQTVSLTSLAGGISETGSIFFPQIEAGTLNLSAAGAITLHRDNDIDNLGVVTAGGAFTFNDVDGFNLTGNLNVGALVLDARAGSIEQTGGVITAASIDAEASQNLLLNGANQITSVTALRATAGDLVFRQAGNLSVPATSAGGSISLYSNTGSVTQTGAITAATLNVGAVTGITLNDMSNDIGALGTLNNTTSGQISFTNADGFDLTGAITAGGSQFVSLTSISGGITQQVGGTITAQVLSVSASTGATLDGNNDVDSLGSIIAGPSFTFKDVDDFDITGMVSGASVTLNAGGAITQSTGVISGGTLSLTAASATLNGLNNIGDLSDVDVSGSMSFQEVDGFNLTGAVGVDGTLSLTSGGAIEQTGGAVTVGTLNATSATGGITLQQTGNVFGNLGTLSSSFAVKINSGGGYNLTGDVTAADLFLSSGGAITQSGGAIRAGNIWAGAVSGLSLTSATNDIDTIWSLSLTGVGSIDYVDTDGFTLGGGITTSGAVSLTAGGTGSITQDPTAFIFASTLSLAAGGDVSATGNNDVDTVNLSGANVSFRNGDTFAANVITATGAVSLTSSTGKITQTALTGRIVAGSLTASAATGLEFFGGQNDIATLAGLSSTSGGVTYRDRGGFDIAGNITAAGQLVELVSDGTGADGNNITQSGGVITASRLTGTSAGDFLLTQANVVGRIDALNAGGALTYRGAGNVELWGNLSAGTTLNLVSDTASVLQQGGAISAQTLSGSAALDIQLSRLNDVDNLGAITVSSGQFSFRDTDSFNIAGAVWVSSAITLQAGTDIVQTTGSLTTGGLSVFANGLIDLGGPGNDINSLAAGFAGSDFRFADVNGFSLDGNVFAGGVMTLSAAAGTIDQNDGVLTAATLNASAANELNLTKANAVATLGNLSAGNRIYFASADSFSIAGNLASDLIVLASLDGGVTQTGGAITAASLAVDAKLNVALGQAGNDVDTLSYVTVRNGDFTFRDSDSLSVSGPMSLSGVATFNVGGDLTQTAAGIIAAQRVQGSAANVFDLAAANNLVTQLGPITAASIGFKADGALDIIGDLTATNIVSLVSRGTLSQSGGVVIGDTLSAESLEGDVDLGAANTVAYVQRLRASSGDVTFRNGQGFELTGAAGDILADGAMTLTADTGGIHQSGAGLQATTLIATAADDVVLNLVNQVANLGAISAGGDFVFANHGDLALTGDITTGAGKTVDLASVNGSITQTGGVITAGLLKGSAVTGASFGRDNAADQLGAFSVASGDFLYNGAGSIFISGLISVASGNRITLTTDGGLISTGGVGRLVGGSLVAGASGDIGLQGDIDRIEGLVSTNGDIAWVDDDGFELAGDVTGRQVVFNATGDIVQTAGVIRADDTFRVNNWLGDTTLNGANQIRSLGYIHAFGSFSLVNAGSLTIRNVMDVGGDLTLRTTAGDIVQTGATTLIGDDVTITAAGLLDLKQASARDDMTLNGESIVASALALTGAGADLEGDNYNLTITSTSGGVRLGAASVGAITTDNRLERLAGSGAVTINSAGEVAINLDSANAEIGFTAAGQARVFLANGDLDLADISATGFSLTARNGELNADSVTIGGGDYIVEAQDFTGSALNLTGTARDISITDTVGDLTLVANLAAQRNLTISAAVKVLQSGSVGLVAGADLIERGDLTINALGITVDTIGADGNVTLNAGNGVVDVATLVVGQDYNLTGGWFSNGALTPLGGTFGTWTLNAAGPLDFTGLTLTYNGDINIRAGGDITGQIVQSIMGSVTIDNTSLIDVGGLYAGEGVRVSTTDRLVLGSATASAGDVDLAGGEVSVNGLLDASGEVRAAASNGAADIAAAKAGGNILVTATNGDARLGAANLAGLTGDLTVSATGGSAILGAIDALSISTDNVVTRATGGAGTVSVTADTGDARVYLDNIGTTLNLLQGGNVDVAVATGAVTIGALTALNGDIDVETLDGALTVGATTAANGGVWLKSRGGDLILTGDVFGQSQVSIDTNGRLDGALASLIRSDGSLDLLGASINVGRIEAGQDITAAALDGDAYVEFAGSGGLLQIGSATGNATLRGAEAANGILVVAERTATFGADTAASIGAGNYGIAGSCGCAGGIVVASTGDGGRAVVNLGSVVGEFQAISALRGDVDVNLLTGNLTIGELSGRNITVKVAAGTIETGFGGSPVGANVTGGSYSITAQGFLGDVLNPLLQDEFGAPATLRNYTIVDTLGGLDMTGVSVAAQGEIKIEVQGGGALTGDAQLSSGGDLTIAATAIQAGALSAGGDLDLNASGGAVDIATNVTVGGNYTLTGQDFSAAALSPLGARAGTFRIRDTLGDLDYSAATLRYGGDIIIDAADRIVGGDIVSTDGDIRIQAQTIDAGMLSAERGKVDAYAYGPGGVSVASARAEDWIYLYASTGKVTLGAAALLGTGANTLNLLSEGASDVVLGSALPGGIGAANVFTSAGSSTTSSVSSSGGSAFVHLNASDAIGSVFGAQNVGIVVNTGDVAIGSVHALAGNADIRGPVGRLTVGTLTAGGDADVTGANLSLTDAAVAGDLIVDVSGDIRFEGPAGGRSGQVKAGGEISLAAGGAISQDGSARLEAAGLTIVADHGASLLGGNDVAALRGVVTLAGGFAYNSARSAGLHIAGPINAAGQTVDLRVLHGPLTQSVAGILTADTLTGSFGGGADLRAANMIARLGAVSIADGGLFLNVDRMLTIAGLVAAPGAITIQSDAMTIASTGAVRSTAAGDAVVLAANGVFTNQRGVDAVQAQDGRWLIYSQAYNDPTGSTATDQYGGLGGKSYYGVGYDFAGGGFGAAVGAGNRFVHAYRPTITFTPISKTMTYDGFIPGIGVTVSGVLGHDVGADPYAGSPLLSGNTSKNAGTYLLTASLGSLVSDMNYDFAFGTGTLIIDPKVLTGVVSAQNKTYDGTTAANGAIALTGVVAGDAVTVEALYAFADKNAGAGKTVTASGVALGGADAGNYVLSPVSTALADILRRDITAIVTAHDKTYDATRAATGTLVLSGVLAGDDLSITGDLLFADKNAGTGKVVSVANAQISGADAGNYNVVVGTDVADIARRTLTGVLTANNKTYDGTTAATGALVVNGLIAGDDAAVNATFSFGDKNAGTGKAVTANAVLSGADAGNYELSPIGTALADILRKAVTVSVVVNNKTYDGATNGSGSVTLTGILAGEQVTATGGTYTFADRNAGTGKTVAIAGITLTGSGSGNYELVGVPTSALADILRRQVSVAADGKTKLFGQLDPALTYRLTAGSLVAGDGFSGGLTRAAGENFGSYLISQGTLTLGGNYEILFTPGTFEIRPVPGSGQDGGDAFRLLRQPGGFDLQWDPSQNFTFGREPICLSSTGCTPAE